MRITPEEMAAAANEPGGQFQRAIAAELARLAGDAERENQERMLWDGRGWGTHPADEWRRIWRGEAGGPRD